MIVASQFGFGAGLMVGSISYHLEHIVSSGKPFRFISLFGIGCFTVNLFANQLLGDFGEVGGQGAAQLAKLWPQDLLDKAPWTFDNNGLPMHPAIAKRIDSIPTT